MFLTPYQHGVVREISEGGIFDPTDPQFQNYRYETHDLNELVELKVIELNTRTNTYEPGLDWGKIK